MKKKIFSSIACASLFMLSLASCTVSTNNGNTTIPSAVNTPSVETPTGAQNNNSTPSSTTTPTGAQVTPGSVNTTTGVQVTPSSTNNGGTNNTVPSATQTTTPTTPEVVINNGTDNLQVIECKGDQESIYAEFKPVNNADSYNVYVKGENITSYTKIDQELTRLYKDTNNDYYYRSDAVGLKAGTYSMKLVPVINGSETEAKANEVKNISVVNYDRTGFGFTANTYNPTGDASGAYNTDGTLKNNARVVYITKDNAKTVSLDVTVDNKGKKETKTGLQAILAGYEKGCETTPTAFRIIGKLSKEDLDSVGSSEEGLQIKGKVLGTMVNMTLEGVGTDATIYGFGLMVKNATNLEVRNLGFMTKMDDNVSLDGGSSSTNRNIWVHDCDFFYGPNGGGDHAKGDGALDIKGTQYATLSYNHFWDTGKTTLNSNGDPVDYVSYHHNWYDHSDSRHPRIRMSSAIHVYNNYYDGISKYGVGAAEGATSAFVENNYFRNCKYPMLSSMQGSDVFGGTTTRNLNYATFSKEDGGIIKSYGNKLEGTYTYIPYGSSTYVNNGVERAYDLEGTTSTVNFDAYEASSRDEVVPSTVVAVQGGSSYSNFDTNSSIMYQYTVQTPEDAVVTVKAYAGRVQGGDLKWSFDNSTEDTNYAVIPGLRSAIDNYSSKLVKVQGSTTSQGSQSGETPVVDTSADAVIALIDALPNPSSVTEADRTNINAAKTAYDALSSENKAKVTNYSKLESCISALPAPSTFTIDCTKLSANTSNQNVTVYNENNIVVTCTKVAANDTTRGLKFNSGKGFTINNNSSNNLQFVLTFIGSDANKSFTYDGQTVTFGKTATTVTVAINAGSSMTFTTSTGQAFLTSILVSN